jgi:hypothetical protein
VLLQPLPLLLLLSLVRDKEAGVGVTGIINSSTSSA